MNIAYSWWIWSGLRLVHV